MAMIRERRNLNIGERFRKTEYWPFSSAGEIIDNRIPTNTNTVYETFDFPLLEPSTRDVIFDVTEDFATTTASTWDDTTIGTGTTWSYAQDPVSATGGRGQVKKVAMSNTSGWGTTRLLTIQGKSAVGINTGRLTFWHRKNDLNNNTTIFLRSTTSDFSDNYYSLEWSEDATHGLSAWLLFRKKLNGTTSALRPDPYAPWVDSPNGPYTPTNNWTYHDIRWTEFYSPLHAGNIFYIKYSINEIELKANWLGVTSVPWNSPYYSSYWYDLSPSPQSSTNYIGIRFDPNEFNGNIFYLDSVRLVKYKDVLYS